MNKEPGITLDPIRLLKPMSLTRAFVFLFAEKDVFAERRKQETQWVDGMTYPFAL